MSSPPILNQKRSRIQREKLSVFRETNIESLSKLYDSEISGKKKKNSFDSAEKVEDINKNIFPTFSFIDYSKENLKNFPKQKKTENTLFQKPKFVYENYGYSYVSQKYEKFFLDKVSIENFTLLFPGKKINVVLDIDQTLIYSKDIPKLNEINKKYVTKNSHQIQVNVENKNFDLVFNLRSYLKEFLFSLKKFCNFYICTLSHENYARQILEIIKDHTGIFIPEENVVAVGAKTNNEPFTKALNLFQSLKDPNNTIIVDDSAMVWKDQDLQNIILSKKFYSFNDNDHFNFQYLGEKNARIDCIVYDEDDTSKPIHYEGEATKKKQLRYITEFIEKSFKLSLIRNEEVLDSMNSLKRRILGGTKINFMFFGFLREINFLKEIIKYLGGETTVTKNEATHFIISKENLKSFEKPTGNHKYYCVNKRWLFHCYFFLRRMNENSHEYQVIV